MRGLATISTLWMVLVGTSFTLPAQTRSSVDNSQSVAPTEVSLSEVADHFIAGRHLIHSAMSSNGINSHVELRIVVTPAGTVSSAIPFSGTSEFYVEATSLATTWRFQPFLRSESPVYATFTSSVPVVPPERRPREHKPFPEIKNWDTLRITLERGGCFGTCPIYTLTVSGDGSVVYNGRGFVEYCGELRSHVSQEAVRHLLDLFRQGEFFDLFDHYELEASDLPAYITSITFDGNTKSVVDYVGQRVGLPEAVSDIENSIDQIAGPKVWARESDTNLECQQSRVPTTVSHIPVKIE